jgi:hypothetical protein
MRDICSVQLCSGSYRAEYSLKYALLYNCTFFAQLFI